MGILVAEDDTSLGEYLRQRLLREEFAVRGWPAGLKRNAMLQTSRATWWCWI
jgi:DNA-binding response OmpR family regulator